MLAGIGVDYQEIDISMETLDKLGNGTPGTPPSRLYFAPNQAKPVIQTDRLAITELRMYRRAQVRNVDHSGAIPGRKCIIGPLRSVLSHSFLQSRNNAIHRFVEIRRSFIGL